MRHELAFEADRLAGLRVTAHARGAIMQREAAKTANLDAIASGQALGHLLKHGLDGQLHVLGREQPLMGDNTFDQLRLRHIFPFFIKQLDHCLTSL
ncbi:hypothetical protein D3C85_1529790 [compost metagenome]